MKIIKSLAISTVLLVGAGNATSYAAKLSRKEKYQGTKLGDFFTTWAQTASFWAYLVSRIWNPDIKQEDTDKFVNALLEYAEQGNK